MTTETTTSRLAAVAHAATNHCQPVVIDRIMSTFANVPFVICPPPPPQPQNPIRCLAAVAHAVRIHYLNAVTDLTSKSVTVSSAGLLCQFHDPFAAVVHATPIRHHVVTNRT